MVTELSFGLNEGGLKLALFIDGMECPLCGKPIMLSEDVKLFPPLTSDRTDPMWEISDSAVHSHCFMASPLAEKVSALLDQLGFGPDE